MVPGAASYTQTREYADGRIKHLPINIVHMFPGKSMRDCSSNEGCHLMHVVDQGCTDCIACGMAEQAVKCCCTSTSWGIAWARYPRRSTADPCCCVTRCIEQTARKQIRSRSSTLKKFAAHSLISRSPDNEHFPDSGFALAVPYLPHSHQVHL